jgi:phosphoribosylanthranilate isomerase
MARTLVKFCGLTHPDDIRMAVDLGVDFIGFNFYEKSPRKVTIDQASNLRSLLPSHVRAVGLFVDQSLEEIIRIQGEIALDVLQFHGDQPLELCQQALETSKLLNSSLGPNSHGFWRALRIAKQDDLLPWCADDVMGSGLGALLLDSFSPQYGGTGHAFDWRWVAPGAPTRPNIAPLIAAGGLHPKNVREAIQAIRPFAVDVSSGIQQADVRRKSEVLMREFLEQVRIADACSE